MVHERHPELDDVDVETEWGNALASVPRIDKDLDEYAAIGIDGKGRLVVLVAKRTPGGDWVVYRAKTPPTAKMRSELSRAWRNDG